MKRSVRHVGVALASTALLCSGAPASADSGGDRAAVRQAMEELAKSGAAGVQVRLHDGDGEWTGSAGVAELGKPGPVPENGRFRVGSIAKTMVATVLLQLVDEGKVDLDRPAVEYLPQFELDHRITVRMLLQQTSGLFNYTGEPKPDGSMEPGIPLQGQGYVDNRFRTYQPEELVRLALSKPARFEPGTRWSYSNTNYVLAGLLIERITGNPYADELRRRVIEPVGMTETTVPGTRTDVEGPHAHGYLTFSPRGRDGVRVVDVTESDPSWGFGAGEVISTTEDLDRFFTTLLDGRLMSPRSLDEMRTMRPSGEGAGYGLGLMRMDLGECGVVVGHTGGMPGYNSISFMTPDQQRRLEMSVTLGLVDSGDPESLQPFQQAADKVLAAGLCDAAE